MVQKLAIQGRLGKDTIWNLTLVYDLLVVESWARKCLEILKAAKNLPDKGVELISAEPANFQCIDFGWKYDYDYDRKYASFVSTIYYNDLMKIVGVTVNNELDITHPTPSQEIEICKIIMNNLWKEYNAHIY